MNDARFCSNNERFLVGGCGEGDHARGTLDFISQFEEWGYKIIFYPTLSVQVVMKALIDLWADVKQKGREKEFCKILPQRGISFDEFMERTGFHENQAIRDKYLPK